MNQEPDAFQRRIDEMRRREAALWRAIDEAQKKAGHPQREYAGYFIKPDGSIGNRYWPVQSS